MEWKEIVRSIEVPPNTGVEGFVYTIRELLKRPRLQEIKIDSKGKITYRQFVREDKPENNIGLEFGDLLPSSVIRNSEVIELAPVGNAAVVLSDMLDTAAIDQLHPICFTTGADSTLWNWYKNSTGLLLRSRDTLFGLPLYLDRQIPDTAIILCAAFGKDASMIDTQRAYKVEMQLFNLPDTTVEVFDE